MPCGTPVSTISVYDLLLKKFIQIVLSDLNSFQLIYVNFRNTRYITILYPQKLQRW